MVRTRSRAAMVIVLTTPNSSATTTAPPIMPRNVGRLPSIPIHEAWKAASVPVRVRCGPPAYFASMAAATSSPRQPSFKRTRYTLVPRGP